MVKEPKSAAIAREENYWNLQATSIGTSQCGKEILSACTKFRPTEPEKG
jgi:hypothetical protein